MDARIFYQPKDREAPEDYEDAAALGAGTLAIADGASTTSFSGLWARLLCDAWAEGSLSGTDAGTLAPALATLAARWRAVVAGYDLPWFAQEKARQGAHAAFLGVRLEPDRSTVAVTAVGDCCLFVAARGQVALSFPAACAGDIAGLPLLLGTDADGLTRLAERLRTTTLPWPEGATLYLASDALARWVLNEGARALWMLADVRGARADALFAALVERLQQEGRMALDDVTLVVASR